MKYVRTGAILQWLAILCAVGILLIATTSYWMLAVICGLILLPILSCIWNFFSGKRLKCTVAISGVAEKNGDLVGCVTVSGGFLRPLGRMRYVLHVENELTGEESESLLKADTTARGYAGDFSLKSEYSGRLRVTVKKLVLYDFFGMIPIITDRSAVAKFTVYPDIFPLEPDPQLLANFAEDGDVFQENRPGNDPSEVFQLREYVPGDRIRKIHWKLSSKIDQLIVRDEGQPMDQSLLIYWDRFHGTPKELDALAEAVFSVCRCLSEAGYAYVLGWSEAEKFRREGIASQERLLETLPLLLKKRKDETPVLPATKDFGSTLYFTAQSELPELPGQVKYLCCGTLAATDKNQICFTAENCRETLQRMGF